MTEKMSIWGVGPVLAAITFPYGLVAVLLGFLWPEWFTLPEIPQVYGTAAGVVLLAVCLLLYVPTVRAIDRAHGSDRLVTTGVYGACRHPLYSLWILLLLPAVACLLRSWLFLTASLVMYLAVRFLVRREEQYLEERFGGEYADYKRRVNAVFPTFWR